MKAIARVLWSACTTALPMESGIMNVVLGATPKVRPLPKSKLRFRVAPPRDPLPALAGGFVDSYSDFPKRILSVSRLLVKSAGAQRTTSEEQKVPTQLIA